MQRKLLSAVTFPKQTNWAAIHSSIRKPNTISYVSCDISVLEVNFNNITSSLHSRSITKACSNWTLFQLMHF